MARKAKQKGTSGAAVHYISRKQALKKLQLPLKDFRRLCILKGIYPVEPNHHHKVNHGSSAIRTYYFKKDIQFLMHEPIINKFREFKIFMRRLAKAEGKKDPEKAATVRKNWPKYELDHIVKERYPTFFDAVRDLDDTLSMCFLMATYPKSDSLHAELVGLCRRLTIEFMHYVIESKSLRKVFISIKGYYYQAEINGETITWIVPHTFGYIPPDDVDFRIMVTFTEFYTTMLGFVNYKLFQMANMVYPPQLTVEDKEEIKDIESLDEEERKAYVSDFILALNQSLKSTLDKKIDDLNEDEVELDEFADEENENNAEKLKEAWKEADEVKKLQNLFKGTKFFLNREVPRESLVFVIRAFGGEVSWDNTIHSGATYDETDDKITHQIVDRPNVKQQYLNRYYIQPQWVYDSVNAKILLPMQDYYPGTSLPPHLSPFVEEKEGEYVPPEKLLIKNLKDGKMKPAAATLKSEEHEDIDTDFPIGEIVLESDDDEESKAEQTYLKKKRRREEAQDDLEEDKETTTAKKMNVKSGKVILEDKAKLTEKQEMEDKRMAVMMIPKKKRRLYEKIMYGKRRNVREAEKLKQKREDYDKNHVKKVPKKV